MVTRYSFLKKASNDGTGILWPFKPLRAVGLAFEKGLKLNKELKAIQEISAADLSSVHASGTLQVFEKGHWQSAHSRTLQLTKQDSEHSLQLLHKARNFITEDLQGNIWDVDVKVLSTRITLDMVCDFLGREHMAVKGRVWVECKQVAAAGFDKRLADLRKALLLKLEKVKIGQPSISTVMLLMTKNEGRYGGGWAEPGMVCEFYDAGRQKWANVSPAGLRVVRFQVPLVQKVPLAEVWPKVAFFPVGQGPKQGVFNHLLKAMNLPAGNAGKRAGTVNQQLAKLQIRGKPFKGRLLNRFKVEQMSGQRPWLGTKSVLAQVHKLL